MQDEIAEIRREVADLRAALTGGQARRFTADNPPDDLIYMSGGLYRSPGSGMWFQKGRGGQLVIIPNPNSLPQLTGAGG